MSVGIFAPGLMTGTSIYFVLGVIGSIVGVSFFARETPNITKGESQRLALVVVWVATICMWLFWAFTYMHQMVPIIYPIKQVPTMANS